MKESKRFKVEITVSITDLYPREEMVKIPFSSWVQHPREAEIVQRKEFVDEVEYRIVESIYQRLMRDRDLLINFKHDEDMTIGRIEIIPPDCLFKEDVVKQMQSRDEQ